MLSADRRGASAAPDRCLWPQQAVRRADRRGLFAARPGGDRHPPLLRRVPRHGGHSWRASPDRKGAANRCRICAPMSDRRTARAGFAAAATVDYAGFETFFLAAADAFADRTDRRAAGGVVRYANSAARSQRCIGSIPRASPISHAAATTRLGWTSDDTLDGGRNRRLDCAPIAQGRRCMSLTNQVALVTGAGQGIGKASALALAEAGAHVVVADIDRQKAEATADAIMSTQRRALAVQADVGDLQRDRPHGARGAGAVRPDRHPAEQCRRDAPRRHHGSDRGRLGPHPPRQCEGRVLLPAARGAGDDSAAQRADHQHRLDRRQRLRGRVQRSLCREQGRGDQPDQDWPRSNWASTTSTSIRSAQA